MADEWMVEQHFSSEGKRSGQMEITLNLDYWTQGAVLSFQLYSTYIADIMISDTPRERLTLTMYTNDTVIATESHLPRREITKLQSHIDKFEDWRIKQNRVIKPEKSEA